MTDELDGKIITAFAESRSKTYTYLIDDGDENKKAKRHKKCHKTKIVYEQLKLKMK